MFLIFNKLKLKNKLLFSHGMIIFLLVILAGVSFYILINYNDRFVGYSTSTNVINKINTIHGNVYKAFTFSNSGISKDIIDNLIVEQKKALAVLVTDIKKLSDNKTFSKNEKEFYEVAYKNIVEYDKIVGDSFDIATTDPTIASLYLTQADEIFKKLIVNLDKLFQYEKASIGRIYSTAIIVIVATSLFSIILSFFLTMRISSLITIPILMLRDLIGKLSEGDLTNRIKVKTGDELELLTTTFNAFVQKIEGMISAISQSTENITLTSGEISKGNQNLSSRTIEQATNIESTAASLEEICASINEIGSHVNNVEAIIIETKNMASTGVDMIKGTIASTDAMLASSSQIADIVKLIQSIAFQINILALNASVEAARVGAEGRGFMVVAGEVKKLAASTAGSVKEITNLIETSVKNADSVGEGVKTTEEIFTRINDNVLRIAVMMRDVNSFIKEQQSGTDTITQAMEKLDSVTQQNSALVEESAAATEELFNRTEELSTMVGFFKVRADSKMDVL
jgi:methyl-accepting chemotaxis protein